MRTVKIYGSQNNVTLLPGYPAEDGNLMYWVLSYCYTFLDPVIPWYYYVPREGVESERSEPYSMRRIAASK